MQFISLLFCYGRFKVQLCMRLLYFLSYCLVTLRGNHERLFQRILFRLIVYGDVITYLILLSLQIFLEFGIVVSTQRNYYSSFSIVLRLAQHIVIFILFNTYHFKTIWKLLHFSLFLFNYKHNFWQVFNCEGDNLISKLIINPKHSSFKGLVCCHAGNACILDGFVCNFQYIRSKNLMYRSLLKFHLSEYNLMALSFCDYRLIGGKEVGRCGVMFLWVICVEHATILVLHSKYLLYVIV